MKIVIFAGGKGTRLWPLSRSNFPKQFLSFGDGVSLLQKTILRFLDLYGSHSIVVITSKTCASLVQSQCLELDPKGEISILVEPCARSTAPALCLAIRLLEERKLLDPNECILAAPSDGLFFPEKPFLDALLLAEKGAKLGFLSLFGKTPTRPESGYGYLRLGRRIDEGFYIEQFVEKPSKEKAADLISLQDVLWNLGHLVFLPEVFWKEMKLHSPELGALQDLLFEDILAKMGELPNLSLDHGLLEKSSSLLGYPVHSEWSDIGSWETVYEILSKDEKGNVKRGAVIEKESKNCLFLSEKRLIAAIGLEDLFVVETESAILVAKKGQSQQVKEISDLYETKEKSYQMETISIDAYQKKILPKLVFNQRRLVVLKGCAQIEIDEDLVCLRENETVCVPSESLCIIENKGIDALEILSIQTGEVPALC